MENASKALLMAGGVLIAMVTLAVLINSFSTTSQFQMSQLSQEEQEKLVAFNEQYTKYANQYVYGTEVITVINKTLNNQEYKMNIYIKFAGKYSYITYKYENSKRVSQEIVIDSGETLAITNDEDIAFVDIDRDDSKVDSIKNRAFKCTDIKYDNSTGRVNSITFEEKKWGNLY